LDDQKIQQLQKAGLDQFIITEQHQAPLTQLNHIKRDGPKTIDTKVHLSSFKNLQFTNRGGLVKVGSKMESSLNFPCFIPYFVMVITLSGLVVACYEDYFQKHVMGDIKKSDILDIWLSEKYTHFRNELKAGNRHLFEVCKNCNNKNILL
jgi:radical SAM protein with 4Fe4S-binding SPASM domain